MVTHDLDSLFSVCDQHCRAWQQRVMVEGTIDDMLSFDDPWVQILFPRQEGTDDPGGGGGGDREQEPAMQNDPAPVQASSQKSEAT